MHLNLISNYVKEMVDFKLFGLFKQITETRGKITVEILDIATISISTESNLHVKSALYNSLWVKLTKWLLKKMIIYICTKYFKIVLTK
jgi:hypothetical protein